MNLLLWAALLIILSFWVLGYVYVKLCGDIAAKEHKVSMTRTKLKHQIAGLEREKAKLDEKIQELIQEMDETRNKLEDTA
ncbi:hypothetical protein [Desulfonatronovibrio hydrogenovorans]|uniref:hypothetical protein n=1 Tax=Desulfonatronovibrio hydrogenovorans TaxID=53245 RepID=UPI0004913756|nr:hypothetical protein [Desulfonatronovibrio hydrogenovorans]